MKSGVPLILLAIIFLGIGFYQKEEVQIKNNSLIIKQYKKFGFSLDTTDTIKLDAIKSISINWDFFDISGEGGSVTKYFVVITNEKKKISLIHFSVKSQEKANIILNNIKKGIQSGTYNMTTYPNIKFAHASIFIFILGLGISFGLVTTRSKAH